LQPSPPFSQRFCAVLQKSNQTNNLITMTFHSFQRDGAQMPLYAMCYKVQGKDFIVYIEFDEDSEQFKMEGLFISLADFCTQTKSVADKLDRQIFEDWYESVMNIMCPIESDAPFNIDEKFYVFQQQGVLNEMFAQSQIFEKTLHVGIVYVSTNDQYSFALEFLIGNDVLDNFCKENSCTKNDEKRDVYENILNTIFAKIPLFQTPNNHSLTPNARNATPEELCH
jgi:hypothetical protein